MKNHRSNKTVKEENLGLSLNTAEFPFFKTVNQLVDLHLNTPKKIFKHQMFFGSCDINIKFTKKSYFRYFKKKYTEAEPFPFYVNNILKIEKFTGMILLYLFKHKSINLSKFFSILVGDHKIKSLYAAYLLSFNLINFTSLNKNIDFSFQNKSFLDNGYKISDIQDSDYDLISVGINSGLIDRLALFNQDFQKMGLKGRFCFFLTLREILLCAGNQLGGH